MGFICKREKPKSMNLSNTTIRVSWKIYLKVSKKTRKYVDYTVNVVNDYRIVFLDVYIFPSI